MNISFGSSELEFHWEEPARSARTNLHHRQYTHPQFRRKRPEPIPFAIGWRFVFDFVGTIGPIAARRLKKLVFAIVEVIRLFVRGGFSSLCRYSLCIGGMCPKCAHYHAERCRAGVGKRYGWKDHPRSAFTGLGEPASEGAGYCNRGDYQENGHKHSNRVAGAIKTSAGNRGDVCHQGASGAGR
jgi:hypothetical protein